MRDTAGIAAAVAAADAEARHHKRLARHHRISAQIAAARRDRLKAKLAEMGIALISAE
jgi:hypothetical protein